MNTIPSAEFRKVYAKLTEPTVVTVNGHPIGVWRPSVQEVRPPVLQDMRQTPQARRDDLLRKINRHR